MQLDIKFPRPQPPARRLIARFGELWCADCGYQWKPIQYCRCAPAPADVPAADGPLTGLEQRVRDCQGTP